MLPIKSYMPVKICTISEKSGETPPKDQVK